MRNLIGSAAVCFMLLSSAGCADREYKDVSVIPYPHTVKVTGESVALPEKVEISVKDSILLPEAEFLAAGLAQSGYETSVSASARAAGIHLAIDRRISDEEGYRLETGKKRTVIYGGTPAGVFYGIQTFLQEVAGGTLYKGTIEDAPRYPWRGFMLDEARHFSGAERVKQLLDIMAYYKMNRFHWHLTDAQGWRIEIKSYPDLALVGGRGSHSDPDAPVSYYTQDQIRDIVEYAAARHIEIIPEIDMPGHATAANRAYPEFNGGGTEQFPDFTFNVGKEGTYAYLTSVLREIASLFPSPYIHIGGDEVYYGIEAWKTDPYVQSLMKRENMTDVREAERYFMHRMIDSVSVLGKTVVGWDELIDLNADKDRSVVMWWRHDKPEYLDRSLSSGYTTVMCPRRPLYFDFIQYGEHRWGRIWDGFCPIEDVYSFPDPWIEDLTDDQKSHIAGIQANLWCELNHTPERVDFMIFPRLCALAESAWSMPEVKDFSSFEDRLEDAYELFDSLGIYYFDTRNPEHHPEPAGPEIRKAGKQKMDYRD